MPTHAPLRHQPSGPLSSVGGRHARRLLRMLVLVLSTMDIGLYVLLFIFGKVYLCENYVLSQGVTRCDRQATPALELIMFLWPGAFAFAPLFGVVVGLSSALTSSSLVRIYAGWSRLAVLNTVVALALFLRYQTAVSRRTLGGIVGLLVGSRVLQVFAGDWLAAHEDRKRFNKGWSGLTSSLEAALDTGELEE